MRARNQLLVRFARSRGRLIERAIANKVLRHPNIQAIYLAGITQWLKLAERYATRIDARANLSVS